MSRLSSLLVEKGGIFNKDVDIRTNMSYKIDRDFALVIRIPEEETVEFKKLTLSNCGMPIRHQSGTLIIDTLIAVDFSADLFNSGGNIIIDNLIVEVDGSNLTEKDYNRYHSDALGHFFSKTKSGVSNVTINNIDAVITGKYVQGMMLSEPYNDYSNFSIGRGSVNIDIDYPYALNANQLRDSFINLGDNGIFIKNRKSSKFKTKDIIVKRYGEEQIISVDSKDIYYS